MLNNNILPDFIVIGAMRAGTTTLYNYLSRHPELGMSRKKETDYFIDDKYKKHSIDWYHGQFETGYKCYGEISPNYSKERDFRGVPKRINSIIPNCKFIYIVRDPVERFVSQIRHSHLLGTTLPETDDIYNTHEWFHILDASLYYRQISEYLKYTTMDSILVLEFEKLIEDPLPLLSEIAKFVGVTDNWAHVEPHNYNGGENLAQLPSAYNWLRRTEFFEYLRYIIPPNKINYLKGLITSKKKRVTPEINQSTIAKIAEGVADDADRFRQLTGLSLDSWSV